MEPGPPLRIAVAVDVRERADGVAQLEGVVTMGDGAAERGRRDRQDLRAGQHLSGPCRDGEGPQRWIRSFPRQVPRHRLGVTAHAVGADTCVGEGEIRTAGRRGDRIRAEALADGGRVRREHRDPTVTDRGRPVDRGDRFVVDPGAGPGGRVGDRRVPDLDAIGLARPSGRRRDREAHQDTPWNWFTPAPWS